MGNIIENNHGGKPDLAGEQSQEQISLALNLRKRIDRALGGQDSRSFDFGIGLFCRKVSGKNEQFLFDANGKITRAINASLLDSDRWPTPEWKPTAASISKDNGLYRIEITGAKFFIPCIDSGLSFVLDGNHAEINDISVVVPDEKSEKQRRKADIGLLLEQFPTLSEGKAEIPAKVWQEASQIGILKYGNFLITRIVSAASDKRILPCG